jgi:glycosyltransferase involved in cell wall biosynthesis
MPNTKEGGTGARSPRLIFVTQLVDPDDPVLGFVVGWVRALAARCERLWVIANEVRAVPKDLEAEVISLGKESGKSKVSRGLRYEASLVRLIRTRSADTLVAHMCPVYLNLAAPAAKAGRVRTLLWFAHPAHRPSLRVAGRLADVVISSLPGAFPGSNGRVRYIGQGIDTKRLSLATFPSESPPLRLLMLNRLSPVKGIPVALDAVARVIQEGVDVSLRIVGPATTRMEREHRLDLVDRIAALGIQHAVSLEEGVSPARVPEVIAGSHAVINATSRGSGDKTALEAMAVGRPVIASNPVFAPLVAGLPLKLMFEEGNAEDLAESIMALASDPTAWVPAGRELRRRVEENHSLDHWADQVVSLSGGQRR